MEAPVGVGDAAGAIVVPVQAEVGRRVALARHRVGVHLKVSPVEDEEAPALKAPACGVPVGVGDAPGVAVVPVQAEPGRRDPVSPVRIGVDPVAAGVALVAAPVDDVEPAIGEGDAGGVAVAAGGQQAEILAGLVHFGEAGRGVEKPPFGQPVGDEQPAVREHDAGGVEIAGVQRETGLLDVGARRRVGENPVVQDVGDIEPPVGVGDAGRALVPLVQHEVGRRVALTRRRVGVNPGAHVVNDEETPVGVGDAGGRSPAVA